MVNMNRNELERVARAMVAKGKGILAADESNATIKKRFDKIKVEGTEENRRAYRELLFTAPRVGDNISGVIMYDETLRQALKSGKPFSQVLSEQGILPGIKVDTGTKPMPGFPGELITEGLDGLATRLAEYHKLGAKFAKWRAVIDIGDGIPTRTCIETNAELLARYAALCQEAEIVPIVEPEVLMDGSHTLERCEEVTNATLAEVFNRLRAHRVYLEGIVLKPNMVISGAKCPTRANAVAVAEATVRCLKRNVPAAVPGIAFLSGGQSEIEATEHLNLMTRAGALPWGLSFSYGRALQHTALTTWSGNPANVASAQRELMKRARLNGLATAGTYESAMEKAAA
jgi:fructose-bisphosphate aldolase class I